MPMAVPDKENSEIQAMQNTSSIYLKNRAQKLAHESSITKSMQ
jgi:hypothetical protein